MRKLQNVKEWKMLVIDKKKLGFYRNKVFLFLQNQDLNQGESQFLVYSRFSNKIQIQSSTIFYKLVTKNLPLKILNSKFPLQQFSLSIPPICIRIFMGSCKFIMK